MKQLQTRHDLALVHYNVLSDKQQRVVLTKLGLKLKDEANIFSVPTRDWAIALEQVLGFDK